MTETPAVYTGLELSELVHRLARLRKTQKDAQDRLAEIQARLAQDPELLLFQGFLADAKSQAATVYEAICEQGVELFEQNGDKKPHPAVTIKETINLAYNESLAIAWCLKRLPAAIRLDQSLFEKHARAVMNTAPIKFVTLARVPKATVSQDLSGFLESEE